MMLTELYLLFPLQYSGGTPLHWAAGEGHTTCVEHLLSTPGIDVNIADRVSWCIVCCCTCICACVLIIQCSARWIKVIGRVGTM